MNMHPINIKEATMKAHEALAVQTDQDPLVSISAQIKQLSERAERLERMDNRESNSETVYRKSEMEDIYSRLAILRDALSLMEARSLVGAYAQLVQRYTILDFNHGFKLSKRDSEQSFRQQRRMLFSIANALRQHIPQDTMRAMDAMDSNLDPWRPYEDCLAEVKSGVHSYSQPMPHQS
jgi:hypothetical protein